MKKQKYHAWRTQRNTVTDSQGLVIEIDPVGVGDPIEIEAEDTQHAAEIALRTLIESLVSRPYEKNYMTETSDGKLCAGFFVKRAIDAEMYADYYRACAIPSYEYTADWERWTWI